jgi:hypothetical protein
MKIRCVSFPQATRSKKDSRYPMKRFSLFPVMMLALTALVIFTACRSTVNLQPVTSAGQAQDEAPRSPARPGEAFNLPQPASGLDGLSSYQAALTIQFEGTEGAQPVQWSRAYRMRVSRGGESFRLLNLETSPGRSGEGAARRMLADVDGYQFEKADQEACAALPADQAVALTDQWEPARLLLGFSGAAPSGEDTIEGIKALRYTFDQSSLGQDGLTESAGEVWVAASSGVVLRYLLTQQGGEDYFGEGFSGTLSWSYEVTQIDQPQQLRLPEDCLRPAVLALPVPDDASQVNQSDVYMSFNTSLDEAALLDFYRPILDAAGWQPPETPAAGGFDLGDFDMEDFNMEDFNPEDFNFDDYEDEDGEDNLPGDGPEAQGLHRFSRGPQTITLLVIPGDENNAVTIFLSTRQETDQE